MSRAQPSPWEVSVIHFRAQGSWTLMALRSSVNWEHSGEALRPVQVSMRTFCHRSSVAGRGGWSAAKYSLRWLGHHWEGSAPDTEQMTFSTMPLGRMKGRGVPPG